MKAPYLESSKYFDHFFTGSLHKIKIHIFQNRSKRSIHGLIPFKYKNICELFYITQDKDKTGEMMVNIVFVCHEEIIDIFHNFFNIPTIEKYRFI